VFADLILLVHVLYVVFVVGGLAAIWIGAALKWRWVRDARFRIAHLSAIGFVVLESLIGFECPLTVWESRLRSESGEAGYERGFIEDWLHDLIFYSAPDLVFTLLYVGFALAVAVSMVLVKPEWRRAR
jgi:hypothetical protein